MPLRKQNGCSCINKEYFFFDEAILQELVKFLLKLLPNRLNRFIENNQFVQTPLPRLGARDVRSNDMFYEM